MNIKTEIIESLQKEFISLDGDVQRRADLNKKDLLRMHEIKEFLAQIKEKDKAE